MGLGHAKQHHVVGTSMVAMIAPSAVSLYTHHTLGNVHWPGPELPPFSFPFLSLSFPPCYYYPPPFYPPFFIPLPFIPTCLPRTFSRTSSTTFSRAFTPSLTPSLTHSLAHWLTHTYTRASSGEDVIPGISSRRGAGREHSAGMPMLMLVCCRRCTHSTHSRYRRRKRRIDGWTVITVGLRVDWGSGQGAQDRGC